MSQNACENFTKSYLYCCVSDFSFVHAEREFLVKLGLGGHSLNLRTTIASQLRTFGILRKQDFRIKVSTVPLRLANYI